jgi:hypothetical protein
MIASLQPSCGLPASSSSARRRSGFGPRKRARLVTPRPSWGRRPLSRQGAVPGVPRQASVRQSLGHSTSTPRPQAHALSQSHALIGGTCRAWARGSGLEIFRLGRGQSAWPGNLGHASGAYKLVAISSGFAPARDHARIADEMALRRPPRGRLCVFPAGTQAGHSLGANFITA